MHYFESTQLYNFTGVFNLIAIYCYNKLKSAPYWETLEVDFNVPLDDIENDAMNS